MSKNDLYLETIQTSLYIDIILNILDNHNKLSLNKIIFFSFIIKNEKNYIQSMYRSNSKNNVVFKAISLISGSFTDYCNSIEFIIEAVHILIENQFISYKNGYLYKEKYTIDKKIANNIETTFIKKAIEESENMTDKQFLKEVINNV
ncbi:hypothetical protein [Faecalibacillus intestinalis]|uniref:hypothetical protein n=1 Tax=Faecalibacillus intestinalis TaxID=1982626 RepID=UPI0022E158DE|nr:hypothetical protein [Faecalibacillus intestinalis]